MTSSDIGSACESLHTHLHKLSHGSRRELLLRALDRVVETGPNKITVPSSNT